MTSKQALREAAEKATPGKWRRASTRFNGITAQSAYPLCGKEDILANAAEKRDAEFIAAANPATVLALLDELEAKDKLIAELESEKSALLPVGVMSEKAFHRLEGSEARFIALWPRPGIYLPRKRPEDGVIVYARTAGRINGEG